MLVLSLESSTTSSKGMLFDTKRGILKVEACPFPQEIDDGVSVDTEGAYAELQKIAARISEGQKIDAISLGGTWHNVVVCDKKMQPATRTRSWLDTSASPVVARLRADEKLAEYYYRNCGCMMHSTYVPFKLMHMRESGLDMSDKFIIDQGSYNFYKLSGKKLCTASMASGMGLLNIHKLKYEEKALDIAGITESQLSSLGGYKDYGYLTEGAARDMNLTPGIPVIPAFPDGALNQMGADAMQPGIMTLSVGTSAAMRMIADAPLTSENRGTWCYVSAMDTWLTGAATAGACNCIDWVKKQLLKDRYSYEELTDFAVDKNNMPLFLPFIYGERCPGWMDGRGGGFHDIKATHGHTDFFVSAMEGILFNIKQCYEILCKLAGPPKKIMVSGGILNSPMWSQMLSDILGERAYRTDMEQASLIGGAFVAGHALGWDMNFNVFDDKEETIVPDNTGFLSHSKRYERYLSLYSSS